MQLRIVRCKNPQASESPFRLIQIKEPARSCHKPFHMQWNDVVSVPVGRDLEVAVIDKAGVHLIAFPCRYEDGVWINANARKAIEINPTHWREWKTR